MIANLQELRDLGIVPRFHGNGFSQIYIGPTTRLHVWHPDLAPIRDHNATIHNHRYDVVSKIHHGALEHQVFDAIEDEEGGFQINIVQGGGAPMPTVSRVRLKPTGRYTMHAGSVYTFPQPLFHTSDANRLTVTVFEQVNDDRSRQPMVISPFGEAPVDAFDPATAPSTEDLWDALHDGITAV